MSYDGLSKHQLSAIAVYLIKHEFTNWTLETRHLLLQKASLDDRCDHQWIVADVEV